MKPLCAVPGCTRPSRAAGRCDTHYRRWRREQQAAERTCATDGCDNPIHAMALCNGCYHRLRRETALALATVEVRCGDCGRLLGRTTHDGDPWLIWNNHRCNERTTA